MNQLGKSRRYCTKTAIEGRFIVSYPDLSGIFAWQELSYNGKKCQMQGVKAEFEVGERSPINRDRTR